MRLKNIFKPRYSPFVVIIIIAVLFAVEIITVNYYSDYLSGYFLNTLILSPLPDIVVAYSSDDPAKYSKAYNFGRDDFSRNVPVWEKVLKPYKGRPGLSYLEIGVYEGRSLIWMLENVLTEPSAKATAVDIFRGDYENTYYANLELAGFAKKVTNIKNYSQLAMRNLPFESYDIIYIDGSHIKNDVLEDAVLSWRLVKPGGLLIFDDYRQVKRYKKDGKEILETPKVAIDPFVQCFEDYFDVVHNEYQLILRRKSE